MVPSLNAKLDLLPYVCKFLLKLSHKLRTWHRDLFFHLKEFNQTAEECTQLYLIIPDVFPIEVHVNFLLLRLYFVLLL